MCEVCKPYGELTTEQVEQQIEAISATFVGLPTVIGAPLLLAPEAWEEVARHQVEIGVRLCAEIPAIKTYTAPTSDDALVVAKAAGVWKYTATAADVETPQQRIRRKAQEQREAFLAEVDRRRKAGELPPVAI
ncbi:phage gene 29 protein family protein [Gordonia sp. DT101]|uniref:phage gene 29 protein family protein n=1 Tax=Gordonia sp. DT101 TaxID=3416545 RepID=UPI003CF3C912